METDLMRAVKQKLDLSDIDASSLSPLALAYIGDAVYELVIRTMVVSEGNRPVGKMHNEAEDLVKAAAQAELVKSILDDLSDEEFIVYKRGRNAKSVSMPRNAKMSDYRMATGFEALIGWMYLSGETERLLELLHQALGQMGVLTCDTKNLP